MISCILAYAKGAETQSATVEFADPLAALFLVRGDERARAALRSWLENARGQNVSAQTRRSRAESLTELRHPEAA